MKGKTLETQFHERFLEVLKRPFEEYGVNQKRLLEQAQKIGGLAAAKEVIRRGRPSDGFYALEGKGALSLSLEALAANAEYAALFTDDEVNHCMDLLCEAGFYKV